MHISIPVCQSQVLHKGTGAGSGVRQVVNVSNHLPALALLLVAALLGNVPGGASFPSAFHEASFHHLARAPEVGVISVRPPRDNFLPLLLQ